MRKSKSILPKNASTNEDIIETQPTFFKDRDAFITWLNEEKPIRKPDDDGFDLKPFALRIASMLLDTPMKTIGLVGTYGCGKSSIIKMVDYYINNQGELLKDKQGEQSEQPFTDKIISCEVSGWGFRQSAAVEHILKIIVAHASEQCRIASNKM